MNIGIIGVGVVGGALNQALDVPCCLYDENKDVGSIEELNEEAEVVFICVPTPYSDITGNVDLSILKRAISLLDRSKIVVIKSTVPPGVTDMFQGIADQIIGKDIFIPEIIKERPVAIQKKIKILGLRHGKGKRRSPVILPQTIPNGLVDGCKGVLISHGFHEDFPAHRKTVQS